MSKEAEAAHKKAPPARRGAETRLLADASDLFSVVEQREILVGIDLLDDVFHLQIGEGGVAALGVLLVYRCFNAGHQIRALVGSNVALQHKVGVEPVGDAGRAGMLPD